MRSFQNGGEEIAIPSLLALTGPFSTLWLWTEIPTTGEIGIAALFPSFYQGEKDGAGKEAGLGSRRPTFSSLFHCKLLVGLPVSSLSATPRHCSAKWCNM